MSNMSNNVSASVNNLPVVNLMLLAVLFTVLSNQMVYENVANLVNSVLPDVELLDEDGNPTMLANALHGVVLALVVYVLNEYVMPGNKILC